MAIFIRVPYVQIKVSLKSYFKGYVNLFFFFLTEFCYYLCCIKYANESGNWQRRYNFELNKLFRDVDVLKFIKLNRVRWAGHLMRMECNRAALKVFSTVPFEQQSRSGLFRIWFSFNYNQILEVHSQEENSLVESSKEV